MLYPVKKDIRTLKKLLPIITSTLQADYNLITTSLQYDYTSLQLLTTSLQPDYTSLQVLYKLITQALYPLNDRETLSNGFILLIFLIYFLVFWINGRLIC
jgi:hypothetical protein